jgi:DNA-binding NtrC family response regulator
MRVLIADDDRDFAEALASILTIDETYEVDIVFSGDAAIERFGEKRFDLAVLDVRMPGRSGIETFFEIQKMDPDSKVLLMTGYTMEQLLDEALQKGVWGVLKKPIEFDKLDSFLRQVDSSPRVLVVDDDEDLRLNMEAAIRQSGIRAAGATNGSEALAAIGAQPVDCLVLDSRMPILDGIGTIVELRRRGLDIPTIFISGYWDEDKSRAEASGLVDLRVMRKPFDPERLLELIAQIVDVGKSR